MTQFSFNEDYDEFGQAHQQISIACPRGWRQPDDLVEEENPFLSSFAEIQFAYSSGEAPY